MSVRFSLRFRRPIMTLVSAGTALAAAMAIAFALKEYELAAIPQIVALSMAATVVIIRCLRLFSMKETREPAFRAIAENAPDAIARFDRNCRYLYANPALQKLAGVSAAAFLGRTPLEVARDKASFHVFQERLREALETGQETEVELFEDSIRGISRPICDHIRFAPEFGVDGAVVSVLAIGRDIGKLKKTERRLRRSRALLRSLAARQEKDREQERKRVAREVLEELGQSLTALDINFKLSNKCLGSDSGALQEHLKSSQKLFDHSIRVVRDVASALRPSVLDIGIDAGLEWLLEKFIEQTGIPGTLRIGEPDLAVNDEYATAIFRIVQEALDNIVRHAQANAVEITLDRSGDDFILEVRDDGQGFDLNTPEEKTLGLVGIQERVRRLGGAVAIFSAPGKGTAIEVRMPVQPNLESV
jgi:PAS domain S-box-containing protein